MFIRSKIPWQKRGKIETSILVDRKICVSLWAQRAITVRACTSEGGQMEIGDADVLTVLYQLIGMRSLACS